MAEYNFSEGMKEYILENYSSATTNFEKALSLKPDLASAHYMLSKIHLQNAKWQDAYTEINKAITLETKNKYYFLQLAQVYERQQNFAEASKVYLKLVSEIPGTEEHYYDLAACYMFLQNFKEAIQSYKKVEELFGKSADLTKQLQQLYLKLNDLQGALREGYNYIEDIPEDIDFQINQAEILHSNNKSDEAQIFLEKLLKENPEVGQARILLIQIYDSKSLDEKSKTQTEYIFNSTEIDVATKLALLDNLQKNQNQASQKKITHYVDLLVKNHPQDFKALVAAGDLYQNYGTDKQQSWKYYLKAKEVDRTDVNLWNKIIQLDSEFNQADSMIVHSEQALEIFPNQAILWLYLGTAYQIKKQFSEAIAALEQGLRLSVGQQNLQLEFNLRLGDNYNETKEFQKSDKAFEDVLKVDFNNDYVLNNYSYYLSIRKEKLDQAKDMAERLVKKYPTNATYLDTYSWVLYQLQDYEQARKYLEVAVTNSSNGIITEHYGDVLFKLGFKDKALDQWNKAKQQGEYSEYLLKKIKEKVLYEN